jgi:hypothetical protein
MIIKYLRTLSINRVCVPYAYSMHVRALAASNKENKTDKRKRFAVKQRGGRDETKADS